MWLPLSCCHQTGPASKGHDTTLESGEDKAPNMERDERWMHPRFLALIHKDSLSPRSSSPGRFAHVVEGESCQDKNCPCMSSPTPRSLPKPFEADSRVHFSVLNSLARGRSIRTMRLSSVRRTKSVQSLTSDTFLPRLPDPVTSLEIESLFSWTEFNARHSPLTPSSGQESYLGAQGLDEHSCRPSSPEAMLARDASSSRPLSTQMADEEIEDYIVDVLGRDEGIPIEFQNDYRSGMRLTRSKLIDHFGAAKLSRSLGILHRIIEDSPEDPNEAGSLGLWARWKHPHAHRNVCLAIKLCAPWLILREDDLSNPATPAGHLIAPPMYFKVRPSLKRKEGPGSPQQLTLNAKVSIESLVPSWLSTAPEEGLPDPYCLIDSEALNTIGETESHSDLRQTDVNDELLTSRRLSWPSPYKAAELEHGEPSLREPIVSHPLERKVNKGNTTPVKCLNEFVELDRRLSRRTADSRRTGSPRYTTDSMSFLLSRKAIVEY